MLQTLRGKQKYRYQVTNVGVEKIELSRSLVHRINEFKVNEMQRKHRSKIENRQQVTQNRPTAQHNTLHYLRLSH